jgi:hypothetical protein
VTFILASQSAFETIDAQHPLQIRFQPDSTKDAHQRKQLLLDTSVDSPRKTIFTILSQYFPKRFAEVVIMQT